MASFLSNKKELHKKEEEMKYKEGMRLEISCKCGFLKQETVIRRATIERINFGMIYLNVETPYNGSRKMFGYEADLDKIVVKVLDVNVEAEKIFLIAKNGSVVQWKVIDHPYFPDQLTLVREYADMADGKSALDKFHLNGSTTLETAYEDAYVLS